MHVFNLVLQGSGAGKELAAHLSLSNGVERWITMGVLRERAQHLEMLDQLHQLSFAQILETTEGQGNAEERPV